MAKFLFIFLCFLSCIHSNEYIYRDITQPPILLPSHFRIVQCSPPRTGSTLIYNILQYLFEDTFVEHINLKKKVSKTHEIKFFSISQDVFYVCTIRNPLDVLASLQFIRSGGVINEESLTQDAEFIYNMYNDLYQFKNIVPKKRLLILKYEMFVNDFDYIYAHLESFFNITINQELRVKINQSFNIEAMELVASNYKDFDQYHPYIGIHGHHINRVNWRKNIPEQYHEALLKKFHPILLFYGYRQLVKE